MKKIYALGFFDGVHLGHQALLSACRETADRFGYHAAVVTFTVHPEQLTQGQAPHLLNTPEDRRALLQSMDTVVELPFDRELMTMHWQDFIQMLLGEQYEAAGFVCGNDFRFGYKGEGTAEKLEQYCRQASIPCVIVPEQTKNGIRISSTYIRQLMESGEMEKAVEFLGHPHILSGTVISGRKLGRTIGIPTANIQVPEGIILPASGVYACKVRFDGSTYLAVTNIGNRPTVGGHNITVEPWLLDFEDDLYGKRITLEFYKFLRGEKKFQSLEDLRQEILKNAEETRIFFEKK